MGTRAVQGKTTAPATGTTPPPNVGPTSRRRSASSNGKTDAGATLEAFRSRITDRVYLPANQLRPHPKNPKVHPKGQRSALEGILSQIGFAGSLLVRELAAPDGAYTHELINGHLRTEIMGKRAVPVDVCDLNDGEVDVLLATYDPVGAAAEVNRERLAELLRTVEIRHAGMRSIVEALASRKKVFVQDRSADPVTIDRADELQGVWKVKPGDIFKIDSLSMRGRSHRIVCGDSGSKAVVERVMGRTLCDSMITDPPYGVNIGEKSEWSGTRRESRIANDDIKDMRVFFGNFMRLAPLATINACMIFMSDQELHTLRIALDDAKFKWGNYLVWKKQAHVLARKDYNSMHEFIVYCWRGRHKFYGNKSSSTVLEFDRPYHSKLHPTMKPIELMQRLIEDVCPAEGNVYDPFAGSGSTMVACERSARACYAIDLDPKYVAVALERLKQECGLKPKLEARLPK